MHEIQQNKNAFLSFAKLTKKSLHFFKIFIDYFQKKVIRNSNQKRDLLIIKFLNIHDTRNWI